MVRVTIDFLVGKCFLVDSAFMSRSFFFGSVSLFKLFSVLRLAFVKLKRNTIKCSAEFMIAHFGASAFDYFATFERETDDDSSSLRSEHESDIDSPILPIKAKLTIEEKFSCSK